MKLDHRIVTLNSTSQNLVNKTSEVDSRCTLSVQNIMTTGYAYLGNASVSTTNYGHKLYPGQSFIIELSQSDNLYAVGDNGVQVSLFELDRA